MKRLNLLLGVAALTLTCHVVAGEKLAVVNGYTITTDVAPKTFMTKTKDEQTFIINRLIEKYLAADFALKTDVVNDPKFEKSFDHIIGFSKKENRPISLIDTVKQTQGFNEEQLLSKKGLLAFDFVLDRHASQMNPDEAKLKAYYELNRYQYDTPAMVEIASIVVEDEVKAKEVITELGIQKVNFDVFTERAKKYSIAPDAAKGGYLGKIPVESLNDTIAFAIQPLKRGEYTEPIKTEFGYQIYYIINQIPEVKTTYEMVKDAVKDEYVRKATKQWAMEKINSLKENAKIDVVYSAS